MTDWRWAHEHFESKSADTFMLGTGNVDVAVFPVAEKSLNTIIRFLQKTEPFSFLDLATDEKELHRFFDEKHIENIVAYIKALQEIGAAASFDDKYSHAVGVLKLIQGNPGDGRDSSGMPADLPHRFYMAFWESAMMNRV